MIDIKTHKIIDIINSRELGIDRRTVKKYLDPNFSPIHVSYGEKKDSILSTYFKINFSIKKC